MAIYTKPTISGYNATPPTDDGVEEAQNEVTWAGIKTKIGDPLKTLIDAVNNNADAAFTAVDAYGVGAAKDTFAALRAMAVVNERRVYLKAHTTEGDGGHGWFRGVTGAAPSSYVNNDGTIAVASGGDGSAAWLRVDVGYVTPGMFGGSPSASSTTNKTAIEAALATGNTVLVTDGEYTVTTIDIPSGARIVGQSHKAVIKSNSTPCLTFTSKTDIVVEGLTLDGIDATATQFMSISNSCERIAFRGCRFINHSIAVYGSCSIALRAVDIYIEDNDFYDCSAALYWYKGERLRVVNNRLKEGPTRTTNRGFVFYGVRNSDVSDNHIAGNSANLVTGILFLYNYTQLLYFNSSHNKVCGNVVTGVKEEAISFDESNTIFDGGDGGTSTSGANTTITDTSKSWTTDAYQNYYVVIADGTGAGNWRIITSNTSNTLTIITPWSENPDATSKYVITPLFVGNVISGNTVRNCKRHGIVLYGPCIGNVIEGNSINDVGQDTTSADPLHAIHVWGIHGAGGTANSRQPCFYNVIKNNSIISTNPITSAPGLRSGIYLKTHDPAALGPDWRMIGNVIEGNTIGDRMDWAIILERVTKTRIVGNVMNSKTMVKFITGVGVQEVDNYIEGNVTSDTTTGYLSDVTDYSTTSQGFRSVTTAPTFIPFFSGERVWASTLGRWWVSTGLTSSDWRPLSLAVESGSGVPSSTPEAVGDEYLDTAGPTFYKAKGTASSSDWVAIN